jgi:hypothetical protein
VQSVKKTSGLGAVVIARVLVVFHRMLNWLLRRVVFVDGTPMCFAVNKIPVSFRALFDFSAYEMVPVSGRYRPLIAIVGGAFYYSESHKLPLPNAKAVKQVVKNLPAHAPFGGRRRVLVKEADDSFYAQSTTVDDARLVSVLGLSPIFTLPLNWILSAHNAGPLCEYHVGERVYFVSRNQNTSVVAEQSETMQSVNDFSLALGVHNESGYDSFSDQKTPFVLLSGLFGLGANCWTQGLSLGGESALSSDNIKLVPGILMVTLCGYMALSSVVLALQGAWLDYRLNASASAVQQALDARQEYTDISAVVLGIESAIGELKSNEFLWRVLSELHDDGVLIGRITSVGHQAVVTGVTAGSAAKIVESMRAKPQVLKAGFVAPVSTDSKGNEMFRMALTYNPSITEQQVANEE